MSAKRKTGINESVTQTSRSRELCGKLQYELVEPCNGGEISEDGIDGSGDLIRGHHLICVVGSTTRTLLPWVLGRYWTLTEQVLHTQYPRPCELL